jgi:basic membrane protein A and related proteins
MRTRAPCAPVYHHLYLDANEFPTLTCDRRTAEDALIRALHAALLTLSVAAAGCARERPEPPPPEPERFDVALLTSGSIGDGGWNASAYEGLRRIQQDLGAAAAHSEARTPADRHQRMKRFAASRIDVVFGHGAEFSDGALATAPSHRETVFIVTSGDRIGPNLAPLHFRLDEATWLLGMAAAFQSENAKAGGVGAVRSALSDAAFDAFRRGAESVNARFHVDEVYTNDPRDTEAARRAALEMIDGGADVLIHQAGEAGAGVLAACTERRILCFAAPRNQNDMAPDALLASAVVDAAGAMAEIAALVQRGRFKPRVFSYGMAEGMVTIVWNEELRRRIAPADMARIDEEAAAIREGRRRVQRPASGVERSE